MEAAACQPWGNAEHVQVHEQLRGSLDSADGRAPAAGVIRVQPAQYLLVHVHVLMLGSR